MSETQSFPLSGELIRGPELHAWLLECAPLVVGPVLLCSAYMRSEAIGPLLSRFPTAASGKVLVRWRFEDLIRGSSDLRVYDLCRQYGLKLYMRKQFHGKAYALPPMGIGMGSANATLSGFGLHSKANDEVCNLVPISSKNLALIEDLFAGATLIDDPLFALLAKACTELNTVGQVDDWPDEILQYMAIEPVPMRLLVDECLWSDGTWAVKAQTPATEDERHDQLLLGIRPGASPAEVRSALDRSPPIRWLRAQLGSVEPAELYFGNLSHRLHSALLDDPGPRRSEVKTLLEQLLSWIEFTESPSILIDRPQHSQRVKLTESSGFTAKADFGSASHRQQESDQIRQIDFKPRPRRRVGN
jgi:hypothetical protein